MNHSTVIRGLTRADFPALRTVLDLTDLFPSDLLEPMADPYLAEEAPHHWLVAVRSDAPIGFLYAEPERMTDGTFNLLAIAVDPALQGEGVGQLLVRSLEDQLRSAGGRVLIVETSSLDQYAATRAFYANQSFAEEARIRDFYSEGEAKVLFWKHL